MQTLSQLVENSIQMTKETEYRRGGTFDYIAESVMPRGVNPADFGTYATDYEAILFITDDGRAYLTPFDKYGEAEATLIRTGFKFIDNRPQSTDPRHLSVPNWHFLNDKDKARFKELEEKVNMLSAVKRDRLMTRYMGCAEHAAFTCR